MRVVKGGAVVFSEGRNVSARVQEETRVDWVIDLIGWAVGWLVDRSTGGLDD